MQRGLPGVVLAQRGTRRMPVGFARISLPRLSSRAHGNAMVETARSVNIRHRRSARCAIPSSFEGLERAADVRCLG
jgi:hypothetical protein